MMNYNTEKSRFDFVDFGISRWSHRDSARNDFHGNNYHIIDTTARLTNAVITQICITDNMYKKHICLGSRAGVI